MHNLTHRITSIKETRSLCLAQIILFPQGQELGLRKKYILIVLCSMCSSHAESKIFCGFFQTQLIFIEKDAHTPLGL